MNNTPTRADFENAEEQIMRPEVEKEPLLPLYEAIHNAIHSSQEAQCKDIEIVIKIQRDANNPNSDIARIEGFSVTDNGTGFNENKTLAFLELFTNDKKIKFNSKGIGRLSFFSSFYDVQVKSNFVEGDLYFERDFMVNISSLATMEIPQAKNINHTKNETTVHIKSLKPEYFDSYTIPNDVIIRNIKEHFATTILSIKSICLTVISGENTEKITTSSYASSLGEKVLINNEVFTPYYIKISKPKNDSHEIILAAGGRAVGSSIVRFLTGAKIGQKDEEKFYLKTYVVSDFLDKCVSAVRSNFCRIPKSSKMDNIISLERIYTEISKSIRAYISKDIKDVVDANASTIASVVSELPHLAIIADEDAICDDLPLSSSKEKIQSVLVQEYAKKQVESLNYVKYKAAEYEKNGPPNFDEFLQSEHKQLQNASKLNHAPLITYVKYREFIIDLFSQFLKKDDQGKYAHEAVCHNLIFPQRHSSDDAEADYENHNLWLIDDRYSAYQFIDSDIPKNTIAGKQAVKKNDTEGNERYDIAAAFSDATGAYNNIFIVELKREHKELSKKYDPIIQIRDYVKSIQAGAIDKHDGTRIRTSSATIYQGLVLCDTHHNYFKNHMIVDHNLKMKADGKSYYTWMLNGAFFLEVMDYTSLLEIAKIRNKAFLEKLKGK